MMDSKEEWVKPILKIRPINIEQNWVNEPQSDQTLEELSGQNSKELASVQDCKSE